MILGHLLHDPRWLMARRTLLVVIWLSLATLTHVPVPASVPHTRYADKVVHLLAYFPLGLLLPACQVRGLSRRSICVAVIAVYGALDELLQIPVGRTASFYDWLADLLGATLGATAGAYLTPQNQGDSAASFETDAAERAPR